MKRFVPLIADAVLAAVCAFLLFFTLVRFYFSTAAGLAAGIIGGLAAGAGAFAYIAAKQSKTASLSAGKREAENLPYTLPVFRKAKPKSCLCTALTGLNRRTAALNARAKPTLQNSVWSPATATICCPPQGLKQIKKVFCMQRRNGRVRRICRRLRRGNNLCGRRVRTFEGARRAARKVYGRG